MQETSLFGIESRPSSQGQQAAKSGRSAEDSIASILEAHGHRFERQKAVCRGIYGTLIKADFYIWTVPGFEAGLCIESKWQDCGGTTDEKLPYLVNNIRQCYPCPVLVVVHGGGFRPGAVEWLRDQADEKLIGVFTLEELVSQVARGFPVLRRRR